MPIFVPTPFWELKYLTIWKPPRHHSSTSLLTPHPFPTCHCSKPWAWLVFKLLLLPLWHFVQATHWQDHGFVSILQSCFSSSSFPSSCHLGEKTHCCCSPNCSQSPNDHHWNHLRGRLFISRSCHCHSKHCCCHCHSHQLPW